MQVRIKETSQLRFCMFEADRMFQPLPILWDSRKQHTTTLPHSLLGPATTAQSKEYAAAFAMIGSLEFCLFSFSDQELFSRQLDNNLQDEDPVLLIWVSAPRRSLLWVSETRSWSLGKVTVGPGEQDHLLVISDRDNSPEVEHAKRHNNKLKPGRRSRVEAQTGTGSERP